MFEDHAFRGMRLTGAYIITFAGGFSTYSFSLTVDFPLIGKYNVGWTGNRSVILKKGARQIWKTAAEAADVIPAISVNLRNLYGSGLLFIGNTGYVLPLTVLKKRNAAQDPQIPSDPQCIKTEVRY